MSEKEEQPPSNPNFGYPPVSGYEPPPPYAQEDHTKFDHGNTPAGGQSPFQPSPAQPPYSQGPFPSKILLFYCSTIVVTLENFLDSYPPAAPTMTTVIVSHSPTVVGPYPVNCQCPNCNAHILTETRPATGTITWLVCAGCLLFG